MKRNVVIVTALFILCAGWLSQKKTTDTFIEKNFRLAKVQLNNMLQAVSDTSGKFPSSSAKDGTVKYARKYDWTSGFFPGILWYAYEYDGDTALKAAAVKWTAQLAPLQYFTEHHDLGFMTYCSYGNAFRLTHDTAYKNILIRAAQSLCTRFNPVTGCIKSWDRFISWHGNRVYHFPVIIDNMMNLELLFFASRETGDPRYKDIAISHALKTIQYQVRKDYSSFHVVCYDTATGQVEGRETAQGYADNSTWSRGQAWGIYGFTMTYRETGDERFLKTAKGMADYFIYHKRLPADKIPFWDFNAEEPGYRPGINSFANKVSFLYRDASAAAVTASGLLELAMYVPDSKDLYIKTAVAILKSLSGDKYKAQAGENANFLLRHSVGSIPHNAEIDVPLVYADYYFLEALLRYNRLLQTGRSV
ncbi:MAG: glycoside hydrolase family 88 protein [Niabella sp.]